MERLGRDIVWRIWMYKTRRGCRISGLLLKNMYKSSSSCFINCQKVLNKNCKIIEQSRTQVCSIAAKDLYFFNCMVLHIVVVQKLDYAAYLIIPYQVRSWVEEVYPGIGDCIKSYIVGHDSLKATATHEGSFSMEQMDIRLRMDGLFKLKEHAVCLLQEFTALYTNGPAAGGGIW